MAYPVVGWLFEPSSQVIFKENSGLKTTPFGHLKPPALKLPAGRAPAEEEVMKNVKEEPPPRIPPGGRPYLSATWRLPCEPARTVRRLPGGGGFSFGPPHYLLFSQRPAGRQL